MSGLTDTGTAPLDGGEPGSSQLTPRRFLVEWLLLTVLMVPPYLAFDLEVGFLAGFGVLGTYIVINSSLAKRRKRREESVRPQPPGQHTISLVFGGVVGTYGLLTAVVIVWGYAAYDLSGFEALARVYSQRAVTGAAFALFLLAAATACYLGSLIWLRWRGALSGSLPEFIRTDLVNLPRSPLLVRGVGGGMACLALTVVGPGMRVLESTVRGPLVRDSAPTIIDIAGMFPILPLGLLAMTALFVVSTAPSQTTASVRTHLEGGAGLPLWQGIFTAGASLVAVIAIIFPIHFEVVTWFSSYAGIEHWEAAYKAVPRWIADQRDKGFTARRIAAKLTEHGHWRLGAPETGLAALMPELGRKLAELGSACEIVIAAAPADPAAVAGKDWISDKTARSGIKYCMRIACPSPVRWDAPPSALLNSSHPSRNSHWWKSVYVDTHADGVAPAPGGYCTADGKLAADFQG